MTPDQEASYALDFGVARSDLPEDARLAYDRLVQRRARAAASVCRAGVTGPERHLVAADMAARGRLRASHADRAHVIETLKAAFVLGMLSKDEFDLRVGQTFASRTYAELAAVLADIPAGLTTAPARAPSQGQAEQPVARPGPVLAATSAAYAGVWAYVLLLSPHGGDNSWGPSLILASGLIYLGILLICFGVALAVRREKHSGGQPPRRIEPGRSGRASPRQASADPGRRRPPGYHGHAHSTDAPRRRVSRLALHPWAGHA